MSRRSFLRNIFGGAKHLATSPDARQFIGKVTDFLVDQLGPEYASLLVTEDQIWEVFVAEAGLSREEAGAMREDLKNVTADMIWKDQQDKKIFLQKFPEMKTEVEGHIRRLRALADEVSKVHKDCTISHVVADSTGVISGIMALCGLLLTPCTGGLSMALVAGGIGLGTASSVTSAATSIVDGSKMSSAKDEAMKLLSTSKDRLKELIGMCVRFALKGSLAMDEFIQCLRELGPYVSTLRGARTNPHLPHELEGRLNRVGSSNTFENVERAFQGPAQSMSRITRILGGVSTGILLGLDFTSLVQDSQHLSQGAESELAKELRRVAQELENKLMLLVRVYKAQ